MIYVAHLSWVGYLRTIIHINDSHGVTERGLRIPHDRETAGKAGKTGLACEAGTAGKAGEAGKRTNERTNERTKKKRFKTSTIKPITQPWRKPVRTQECITTPWTIAMTIVYCGYN